MDDEERKTTLAQNSLTSSPVMTTPPGLANVPTSTSEGSAAQHTVPSHISDDEFYSPMRSFALKAGSLTLSCSGAAHSACPSDYTNEHEVREV